MSESTALPTPVTREEFKQHVDQSHKEHPQKDEVHMIAVPTGEYQELLSDLKNGRRAELVDSFGKAEECALRPNGKTVFELSTNRDVVEMGALMKEAAEHRKKGTGGISATSRYGALSAKYGKPKYQSGPLSAYFDHERETIILYNALTDEVLERPATSFMT